MEVPSWGAFLIPKCGSQIGLEHTGPASHVGFYSLGAEIKWQFWTTPQAPCPHPVLGLTLNIFLISPSDLSEPGHDSPPEQIGFTVTLAAQVSHLGLLENHHTKIQRDLE